MMNPIVSNTIYLNGNGIRLLREGNTEAAIMVFSHALKESKRLLGEAEASSASGSVVPPLPSGFCSRPVQNYSVPTPQSKKQQQQQQQDSAPGPIAPASEGPDYVYEIPFQISLPAPTAGISFPPPSLPITSATAMPFVITCMYNLALAHHARAVQLNDRLQYQTALQLYELGYSVLSSQRKTLPISSMMMLAILNNLGQVHKVLGNAFRARRCLSHLLSLLVFVKERGGCGPGQSLHGFFSNTAEVVLSGPSTAQAA